MGVVVMASHNFLGVGRHGNPLYILHTCTVRARSTSEVRTNQTDLVLMWEIFYGVTFIASLPFTASKLLVITSNYISLYRRCQDTKHVKD